MGNPNVSGRGRVETVAAATRLGSRKALGHASSTTSNALAVANMGGSGATCGPGPLTRLPSSCSSTGGKWPRSGKELSLFVVNPLCGFSEAGSLGRVHAFLPTVPVAERRRPNDN